MSDTSAGFSGHVALVTGAGGGIGSAAALALAHAGVDLALNDISLDSMQPVIHAATQFGRAVESWAVDVSDPDAVETMVKEVGDRFGRIDDLVHAAVFSDREPFTTAAMEGVRRTIDVSMWGTFYVLRAVANAMIAFGRQGSMVIVSSPQAHVPIPNCMAYNMAKAAQDQMARTAAMELLPHRIRVNILHPGWTDTPGERKFYSEEVLQSAGHGLPLGRLTRPDEIARGILFLLDPASEHVTGTTLTIDGGLSLPWWSKRASGQL